MRIFKPIGFLAGIIFYLMLGGRNGGTNTDQLEYPVVYTQQDSLMVLQKFDEMKNFANDPMPQLLVRVAKSFIGSPYVGHTLEVGKEESLVVNLREFDCTTFVETCLALSVTIKSGEPNFHKYCNNLKKIRYRDGHMDGYLSRLHYFSDWISDNQKKGYVRDVTKLSGGVEFPVGVNFMSSHVDAYKRLKADTSLIQPLIQIEKEISEREYFFIPKDSIVTVLPALQPGMIVAFTTGIGGLDIIHTGMLVGEGGKIHMLHASSDFKQVIVSQVPLVYYIEGNKLQTGIMALEVN
jgi:cell wall-associated NlpC family hydrolase